jgi:hypothetical protein
MQLALRNISGKQAAGQVSRRSIPDDAPTLYVDDSVDDGQIEELDASELEDAKGSWGSAAGGERTMVAHAHVPAEAMPSSITRPVPGPGPRSHPADEDGPTLYAPSSTTDPSELAPEHEAHYPSAPPVPHGMMDPQADGGTLIMETPHGAREDGANAYPRLGALPPNPRATFGQGQQAQQAQQQQHQHAQQHPQSFGGPTSGPFLPVDPRQAPAGGEDLQFLAAPSARSQQVAAQPPPQPSRILMLVGVAVVTMVVVIVAGLLVLAMSD